MSKKDEEVDAIGKFIKLIALVGGGIGWVINLCQFLSEHHYWSDPLTLHTAARFLGLWIFWLGAFMGYFG